MKLPVPAWLRGGNDRELARSRYAGRESASDEKARKDAAREARWPKPAKNATEADRTGWRAHDRRDRRLYGD